MMEKQPAKVGWLWIKEGFAIFRRQPAELSTLFFGYMFLMLLMGIVPLIGQMLPMLLIPLFSVTFMQACAYTGDRQEGLSESAAGRLPLDRSQVAAQARPVVFAGSGSGDRRIEPG
jgi:hypothetical protein